MTSTRFVAFLALAISVFCLLYNFGDFLPYRSLPIFISENAPDPKPTSISSQSATPVSVFEPTQSTGTGSSQPLPPSDTINR